MPFALRTRTPLLPAALAFVSFGFVLVRVRVQPDPQSMRVMPLCHGEYIYKLDYNTLDVNILKVYFTWSAGTTFGDPSAQSQLGKLVGTRRQRAPQAIFLR